MKWLIDNWSLLVVIFLAIFLGIKSAYNFFHLSSTDQLEKIKEWALFIVVQMEKTYGSGTGSLKLSAAYDAFLKAFPDFVTIISFEQFSKIIDEALVRMKHLLETNMDINAYVALEDKTEKEKAEKEKCEKGEE